MQHAPADDRQHAARLGIRLRHDFGPALAFESAQIGKASGLELAGVQDVLTKCYGSRNPKNLVRATYEALTDMLNIDVVEELRGVTLAARA